MTKNLDYGKLIDEAMHYVIREALRIVEKGGLSNEHHFFITFDTNYKGVMLPDELKNQYPEEMTIVVQHQFWDLEVENDSFSIVLSFDNVKQNLTVPFASLVSFADPGAKFGLQFQHAFENDSTDVVPVSREDNLADSKDSSNSNVVMLDTFRKK